MTANSAAPTGPQSLADVLRALRTERDLSQEALAERANVSTRLISDLERGIIQRPRRDTVQMLADGLNLHGPERDDFVLIARRTSPMPDSAGSTVTRGPALPAPPNSLIGREQDCATLLSILDRTDTRLITLTGPGGVGKTRLALHVASVRAPLVPGGALFVELATVTDASLIIDAIGRHTGLGGETPEEMERLTIAFLCEGPRLLVLDNLEQIREAGPAVAGLLARCPDLTILATSRIVLRIRAEQAFTVDPLALPDRAASVAADGIAESSAVALLLDRARAVRHTFALTDDNSASIAEIVVRLDGLPLAIELAAARLRTLSASDLLARIDPPLPVLTRGPADLPERLQTMHAAIAWSYGMLESAEQMLLRWLAVFRGGIPGEAADAISAQIPGDHLPNDLVTALVEKSLIQIEPTQDEAEIIRFRMLETIRQFANDELDRTGEMNAARIAQTKAIATLVDGAESGLTGPDQHAWYRNLERDHDNIAVALESSIATGEIGPGLAIGARLYRFWANRGYIREASDWYARLLPLPGEDPSKDRGDCWLGSGVMAYFRGDLEGAEASTRNAQHQFMAIGHELGVAYSYGNLGMIADAGGDPSAATSLYTHALGMFRRLGDEISEGYMLGNLGLVLLDAGELDEAESFTHQSLALYRRMGNDDSCGYSLSTLGEIALLRGDIAGAERYGEEALTIRAGIGHQSGIAKQFECAADIALAKSEPERAITLFGAAARLRMEIGNPNEPRFDERFARIGNAVRSELGNDRYSAAWERGVSLTTDEAISFTRARGT